MSTDLSAFSKMVVCGDCGDVVGPFRYVSPKGDGWDHIQRGTCADHARPSDDPLWPWFDFNTIVELCSCCGVVALRTGSKWSVWFCEACKQEVGLLNGRHGRCVVPIGRHSVHAGWLLKGDQIDNGLDVHLFTEAWNATVSVMRVLSEWQRITVRRNLEAGGAPPRSRVPLPEYVRTAELQIDAMARFREMCEYLDWRGRERVEETGGRE